MDGPEGEDWAAIWSLLLVQLSIPTFVSGPSLSTIQEEMGARVEMTKIWVGNLGGIWNSGD